MTITTSTTSNKTTIMYDSEDLEIIEKLPPNIKRMLYVGMITLHEILEQYDVEKGEWK